MDVHKVGDIVVHWTYGSGEIVAIEDKGLPGEPCFYYVVEGSQLTLWMPVDETGRSSLHLPTSHSDFMQLINILRSRGEVAIVVAGVARRPCPLYVYSMPLGAFAYHIGYAVNTKVSKGCSGDPSPGDDIGVYSFGQLLEGMLKGNLASLTPWDLGFDDAIAGIKDHYAH